MILIYPYENVIQYKEKGIIKEYTVSKKAMQYGKIKNIPIFEYEIGKLIKKEHWVTLLKSKKITLILPIHYNEIDKEIFTVLLNNNGIKNIKYKKETSLLEKKNNKVIINIHKTYCNIVETKENASYKFLPLNIFSSQDDFLKFLLIHYSKETQFLLYGSNEEIITIIKKKRVQNIFYYNNPKNYLITKYIP